MEGKGVEGGKEGGGMEESKEGDRGRKRKRSMDGV